MNGAEPRPSEVQAGAAGGKAVTMGREGRVHCGRLTAALALVAGCAATRETVEPFRQEGRAKHERFGRAMRAWLLSAVFLLHCASTPVPGGPSPSDAREPGLPMFECTALGGGTPKARTIALDGSSPDDAMPKIEGTQVSRLMLGGRRFLERAAGQTFANVDHHDFFHGPGTTTD